MAYLLAAISNDMTTAEKWLGKRAEYSISHPQRNVVGTKKKNECYYSPIFNHEKVNESYPLSLCPLKTLL